MEGFRPEILKEIVTTKMPFGKYEGRLLCDLPCLLFGMVCW